MSYKGRKIRTGLVLSGGIVKGAYQMGFLDALSEHEDFYIIAVSASSIGVLNGYAFLGGKLDYAQKLWSSMNSESFNRLIRRYEIYNLINCLYDTSDCISTPLSSVLWRPPERSPRYILFNQVNERERLNWLKASVSFAPVMRSVAIGGHYFYDGAILDNTPLLPLTSYPLDLILCVQFDGYIPCMPVGMFGCPVLFLNLQDSNDFLDSFCLDKVSGMIRYGYRVGNRILSLLENTFDNKEKFLDYIAFQNGQLRGNPKTGDYVIRKINRICRRLK